MVRRKAAFAEQLFGFAKRERVPEVAPQRISSGSVCRHSGLLQDLFSLRAAIAEKLQHNRREIPSHDWLSGWASSRLLTRSDRLSVAEDLSGSMSTNLRLPPTRNTCTVTGLLTSGPITSSSRPGADRNPWGIDGADPGRRLRPRHTNPQSAWSARRGAVPCCGSARPVWSTNGPPAHSRVHSRIGCAGCQLWVRVARVLGGQDAGIRVTRSIGESLARSQ